MQPRSRVYLDLALLIRLRCALFRESITPIAAPWAPLRLCMSRHSG